MTGADGVARFWAKVSSSGLGTPGNLDICGFMTLDLKESKSGTILPQAPLRTILKRYHLNPLKFVVHNIPEPPIFNLPIPSFWNTIARNSLKLIAFSGWVS
jgi:hypothetical protein